MSIVKQFKLAVITLKKNKQLKNTANLDAEILLSLTLNKPKEFLYAYPETKLTQTQLKKFKNFLKRRLKFEPIAYIANQKEFYGLNFIVNKNVLIPRPETELIIETILDYSKFKIKNLKLRIADIGTGSGCIAIALKKLFPRTNIYASDISSKVLTVAKKNARQHSVKIIFLKGDLLKPFKKINPEIIIANLPYLNKKSALNPSLKFEPKTALRAGKDGLKFYKKLFQHIKKFKLTPKLIICEIGPGQTAKIKKIVNKFIPQYKVKIIKDFSGKNRLLICEKTAFLFRKAVRTPERDSERPKEKK